MAKVSIVKVPVTKGKAMIEVNLENLPDDVYKEVILQGLKTLINRGMTKITAADIPDPETRTKEANLKAAENLEALYANKFRSTTGKSQSKVPGVVMTEARRLARNLVKDEMKRQGIKVSYVEASEITKAANALIEAKPEILDQAKVNLEERAKASVPIDVSTIQISDKRKAAAEAKAASKKVGEGQTSAKQAGIATKSKKEKRQQAHA